MNVRRPLYLAAGALLAAAAVPIGAQQAPAAQDSQPVVARLVAEPASLTMKAGDVVPLVVRAYDAAGNQIADPPLRVSGPRGAVAVGNGQVKALAAGKYEIVASTARRGTPGAVALRIPVTITWPSLSRLELVPEPGRL